MRVFKENNMEIVQVDGDIQGQLVDDLQNTLSRLVEKQVPLIALDMSSVEYIYSRGIGVLVRAQKELMSTDKAMYLFNLKPTVQKILMEVNLIAYLNGFATKEEMDFELYRESQFKEDASLEIGLNIVEKASQEGQCEFILSGTIDSPSDVEFLKRSCQDKIKKGVTRIIFELSDLIYADDKGVHEWKRINNEVESAGGKLVLKGMNEIILDQLTIMEMLGQFQLES